MRPFRNIWMLEEIGQPYHHIVCKPWSRVAKSVHPLGKVPALSVENYHCHSSLKDNNNNKFVIIESAAINTFLGDLTRDLYVPTNNVNDDIPPSARMLVPPPGTPLRAKYDSIAMFIMTELDSQSLWIHRKHDALSNVFGEAPIAVQEAKRQFGNALDVIVDEIVAEGDGSEKVGYLLPTGFSAVDIIFANCCFWAQQIGWLEKSPDTKSDTSTTSFNEQADSHDDAKKLTPKLTTYLQQCRARSAFVKADELRRNQVYKKKENHTSKL